MEELQTRLLAHANACHAMLEALDSGMRAKSEAEAKAALEAFLALVRAQVDTGCETCDLPCQNCGQHGPCTSSCPVRVQ